MTTLTKSRRAAERYAVERQDAATVEFEHAGRRLCLPVYNLSAAGVSFASREEADFADLEAGLQLRGAVVRLGDCHIRGELLVMHVSGRGTGRICGALFYPATDGDLTRLNGVLAGMRLSQR